MRWRYFALSAFAVASAACSSADDSTGATLPGPAGPQLPAGCEATATDPALDVQRDGCKFAAGALPAETLGKCAPVGSLLPVQHIVLLMQENRSFDHYFAHLKGHGQDDLETAPEATTNPSGDGSATPIAWHHMTDYCFEDTNHEWVGSHLERNGGKNDGFAKMNAAASDPSGSRALGYFDESDLGFYYSLASTFAMADHYHCALLGPTFPNRLYFYAGTSFGMTNNSIAPEGAKNIFKALNAAGVTWKVYKVNTPGAGMFIQDVIGQENVGKFTVIDDFAKDAAAGTLPQVAWVDPDLTSPGWKQTSEHPAADMQIGQKWVADQVKTLMTSSSWASSVMFITYDEHGGLYDHVDPPAACAPDATPPDEAPEVGGFDRLGFRVPMTVVSPFAKKHYVSHITHSHTSVLRFIELRHNLGALTARDANSDAMLDMFDFANPPFATPPALPEATIDQAKLETCKVKFPK